MGSVVAAFFLAWGPAPPCPPVYTIPRGEVPRDVSAAPKIPPKKGP